MRTHLALASLALALVACNSGYSSGVDGSKPASTLTPAEARTACESLDDFLQDELGGEEGIRINCYITALSTTTDPEGCQAAYNACVASPPADRTFEVDRLECTDAMADPTCNATVSETEACVNATFEAYDARLGSLSCEIAGNLPELMMLQEPIAAPPECAALSSTCPSLAGGAFGG